DAYSRWAPGNSGGESESIIGQWMQERGNRSKMIIATKVGMEMGPNKKGLGRRHILEAAEASLKRLRTEYIDLYQAHVEDLETPIEETLRAFEDLVKAGKVRAIGASNYSPGGLTRALQTSQELGVTKY